MGRLENNGETCQTLVPVDFFLSIIDYIWGILEFQFS